MKTIQKLIFNKSSFLSFTFFLTFLFSSNLKAQDIKVTGVVKGQTIEKLEVLNGANIFLKGTKTGTSSDRKGKFTFPKKLKIGDILEVSYLGFVTKRITIRKNSSQIIVTLQEDSNEMLGAVNSNKRYKSKRKKQ